MLTVLNFVKSSFFTEEQQQFASICRGSCEEMPGKCSRSPQGEPVSPLNSEESSSDDESSTQQVSETGPELKLRFKRQDPKNGSEDTWVIASPPSDSETTTRSTKDKAGDDTQDRTKSDFSESKESTNFFPARRVEDGPRGPVTRTDRPLRWSVRQPLNTRLSSTRRLSKPKEWTVVDVSKTSHTRRSRGCFAPSVGPQGEREKGSDDSSSQRRKDRRAFFLRHSLHNFYPHVKNLPTINTQYRCIGRLMKQHERALLKQKRDDYRIIKRQRHLLTKLWVENAGYKY